jgi:glycosyltransferase involved in cell wall biosynthesis
MVSAASPRIAYVAHAFPVLTQTFTTREVAALRERGLDVRVFAAKRDAAADLDPEAAAESGRTCYLGAGRAFVSLLAWLLRRPLRLTATALRCLGGTYADDALRCRLRAPLHVALGAALASRLRQDGRFGRVHAQFVDAGSTVAFVAARLLDLPFSFANHTAYNPFLLPLKCRHADLVVSISEFDRQLLIRQSGGAADPGRVAVSRVGIRLGEWRDAARRPEPGRVLVVGGLRTKKGHAVLVRAAARLRAKGTALRLVFAGDGPESPTLRAAAAAAGVVVEFLGAVGPDRVRSELERAAVFALPCLRAPNGDIDGIPVAIMEAMAAGVPVISTRLSGIPELVEHGTTGLLAEPGDEASLAECLARLVGDPALGARLAAAGREHVARLHDLDRTSAGLARLLAGGVA